MSDLVYIAQKQTGLGYLPGKVVGTSVDHFPLRAIIFNSTAEPWVNEGGFDPTIASTPAQVSYLELFVKDREYLSLLAVSCYIVLLLTRWGLF